jgi:3-hydroxyisobutyrate dehydrogenase
MRPGSLFVFVTVDPKWSQAMEEVGRARPALSRAPVSGARQQPLRGELTIISASREAYEKAAGILEAMAASVYRVGARAGAGSTVKLVNQLLVSVHMAAAAEAMALAVRQGVDPQALYDVVTHSFGNSVSFQHRMNHVIEGDYASASRTFWSGSRTRAGRRSRQQLPPALAAPPANVPSLTLPVMAGRPRRRSSRYSRHSTAGKR